MFRSLKTTFRSATERHEIVLTCCLIPAFWLVQLARETRTKGEHDDFCVSTTVCSFPVFLLTNSSLFSCFLNPSISRTAVPFWGQSTSNLTGLPPKRDCGPKRVIGISYYTWYRYRSTTLHQPTNMTGEHLNKTNRERKKQGVRTYVCVYYIIRTGGPKHEKRPRKGHNSQSAQDARNRPAGRGRRPHLTPELESTARPPRHCRQERAAKI